MSQLTIYLVACCKEKREGLHAAENLYCSRWFTLARAYVEQQVKQRSPHAEWFVLSAKHGLLRPYDKIENYNVSLLDMERGPYLEWLRSVMQRLAVEGLAGSRVILLAGKEYRHDLQHWLLHCGATVEVPMQGLGIGEQLHWLKKQQHNTKAT